MFVKGKQLLRLGIPLLFAGTTGLGLFGGGGSFGFLAELHHHGLGRFGGSDLGFGGLFGGLLNGNIVTFDFQILAHLEQQRTDALKAFHELGIACHGPLLTLFAKGLFRTVDGHTTLFDEVINRLQQLDILGRIEAVTLLVTLGTKGRELLLPIAQEGGFHVEHFAHLAHRV